MRDEFEKNLEEIRKEIDDLADTKARIEYALKFVRDFSIKNPYGKVGSAVRSIVENDFSILEGGTPFEKVDRAERILEEIRNGEYAL